MYAFLDDMVLQLPRHSQPEDSLKALNTIPSDYR